MLCPFCRVEVDAQALKCRACGEWLDGRKTPGHQGIAFAKLLIIAFGIIAVVVVYLSIRAGFR